MSLSAQSMRSLHWTMSLQAVKTDDRERILKDIEETFAGGAARFNLTLTLHLLLWPLEYNMDLTSLWARSAGKAAHEMQAGMKASAHRSKAGDLRQVQDWLESEASPEVIISDPLDRLGTVSSGVHLQGLAVSINCDGLAYQWQQ